MLNQVPAEWEVVDVYEVKPVRVYVEDDGATIVRLAAHEIMGAYTFDMAAPVAVRPAGPSGSAQTSARTKRPRTARTRSSHSSDSEPAASTSNPAQRNPPLGAPSSSPSSPPPKITRLGSAFSFLRTHTPTRLKPYGHRRPSASSSSSLDTTLDNSGSGSSDGESDAVPKRNLFARRRNSDKAPKGAETTTTHIDSRLKAATTEEPAYRKADLKRALKFARGEMMKQAQASGKNALVLEGWSITVLRQETRYRLRIDYTGRPAIVSYSENENAAPASRVSPFPGGH